MVYATNAVGLPIYFTGAGPAAVLQRLILVGTVVTLPDGITPIRITVDGAGTDTFTGDPALNQLNGVGIHAQPATDVRLQTLLSDRFGRTPGSVNTQQVIDYTTREGMALYKEATKSLYRDSEKHFDLSSLALHSFIGKLGHRSRH